MDIKSISGNKTREIHSQTTKATKKGAQAKASSASSTRRQDSYESTLSTGFTTKQMQTASKDSLLFQGELPSANTLEIADFKVKDQVDWSWVETRMSGSVTFDNADSLIRHVDTIASTYVATKSHLEQVYAEDEEKLSENMSRLDTLFTQAKQRMVSSYESNIGSFYEGLGNQGARSEMGKSLSTAIEQRVQEMEQMIKEDGRYEKTAEDSFRLIELSLNIQSLNAEESGKFPASITEKGEKAYSLYDLQAAGMVAKAATSINPAELKLMNDNELGIHLAVRYMKVAELIKHLELDKEMSGFLQNSFGSYLDKYTGGALSNKGSAFDSYHYALKQYEVSGDIQKALEQSARKYIGDSFFNAFQTDKNGIGTTKATRYRLELSQFSAGLTRGDLASAISSIAGNRVYTISAYA